MLEIEDDANTELGYPQIVQHQSTFVVGNLVDHFRIHDNGIKRNEVGNEEPYLLSLSEDVEGPLLPKRNVSQAKLDDERILVWFFKETVAERVEHLDGATDDLEHFFPRQ